MELLKSVEVPSSGENYSSDGHVHLANNGVQDEDPDLVNDFESYLDEINERLIISRLVNDTVVKAVLKEAEETVALKDLQFTGLKEQLLEVQAVQQIQEELELILMQSVFHNLKEECEKRLASSPCDGKKRIICNNKLKQVSGICKDLEAVQKSLSNLEQLSTHGSLDSDYSHRRVANNNVLLSSSLWERNGSNEESIVKLPENFESSDFKQMLPIDLYAHLTDMNKMIINRKRAHEADVQAMTEGYFSLKREFLKDRDLLKESGFFLPHKSKDFDVLRKRIPDVMSILNDIVKENEEFSEVCGLSRDEYNNLLTENHHLKDMLNEKEREVKCLSLQISEAEEKLSQKLSTEAHLSTQIEELKTSLDGAQTKASRSEEVNNCITRDLAHQKCEVVENNMKAKLMQEMLELIYMEALYDNQAKMSLECREFSNIQTIMAQEISGVIYQDALKGMETEMNNLQVKLLEMHGLVISLESKASDMNIVLASKSEEKQDLEKKILELETLVEENAKPKITEAEKFDKKLNNLMDCVAKQDAEICTKSNELKELQVNLKQSLEQVHLYKNQVETLTKTLQKAQLESQTTILQERENVSLFIDTKDKEHKKQIITVTRVVQELLNAFEGFEQKVARSVKANYHRLEDSRFQLGSLTKKAKILRTTELWYKEKLERSCTNQQKAEAEVDLLGDELETLVGLLEKIYIALDHYSPVLQHYPGIMETLRLIQRELNVVESCPAP